MQNVNSKDGLPELTEEIGMSIYRLIQNGTKFAHNLFNV
jgi:hypothetical protein